MTQPTAGWYPDGTAPGAQRFWDGSNWVGEPIGPPLRAKANRLTWAGLAVTCFGVLLYFVLGAMPFVVGTTDGQYRTWILITSLSVTAVYALGAALAYLGFRKIREESARPPSSYVVLIICCGLLGLAAMSLIGLPLLLTMPA